MLLETGLLRAGLSNFIYLHVCFFHFQHPLDLTYLGILGFPYIRRDDVRPKGPLATSTFGDVPRVPPTAKEVVWSLQRQPDVTEAARCPKRAQDCHPNTAAQGHWRGHATATPRSLITRTRKLCNISFPPGPPDNDSSETGQPRWRLHTLPCECRGCRPGLRGGRGRCGHAQVGPSCGPAFSRSFGKPRLQTVKWQWVPKASK